MDSYNIRCLPLGGSCLCCCHAAWEGKIGLAIRLDHTLGILSHRGSGGIIGWELCWVDVSMNFLYQSGVCGHFDTSVE